MKQLRNKFIALVALSIFFVFWLAPPSLACYTVIVGKDASTEGCVIVGHNEDDSAPQVVNHHKIGRVKHLPGEKVKLLGGGELDQVPETWAYIWEEMPGMLFSDSFLNEWGVCVTSDNCPSREDKPVLTDGGISKDLRRLIAQRATTAREGVKIAAQLVERFGYDAPGRTYIIADPKEGWLFCVVFGKHWLAKRVPDNQVAMVANTYSVRQVDLKDTANVLASADIVKYAQKRGWYNPKKGSFDFAAAYADPDVAADSSNFCRQWEGIYRVSSEPVPLGWKLPFAVSPAGRLNPSVVKDILRNHYELSSLYVNLYRPPGGRDPHSGSIGTICNETTQTSFVAELRDNMPADIGLVYWVTLGPPCTSIYLPFHFGINSFPDDYVTASESPTISGWTKEAAYNPDEDPRPAYWAFWKFRHRVMADYPNLTLATASTLNLVEESAEVLHTPTEDAALRLYEKRLGAALGILENYSRGLYQMAREALAKDLKDNKFFAPVPPRNPR